ncbi:MAG: lysylphosphatidylglycerol synthase transmembrane domain-containing protein [Candidatus Micrarchaeota archaeon]
MKRKALLALNAAVSIALVAAILAVVGADKVLLELGGLDLSYVALSMLCILLMDLVMSYRISILLEEAGSPAGFIAILKSHIVGMLLADFTPSRSGYFATAAVLHYNYKVPADRALLSIFGPQIFDFAFKVVAGGLALLYLMAVFIGPGQGAVLLIGVAAILAAVVIMLLVLFSRRFLMLFSFAKKLPVASRLFDVVLKMQEGSHIVVKKTPHLIALIGVGWTARALSWYFAAKAVGIQLETPFPEVLFYFFLQPLLTMLEFVPSPTIAGLGLSEGGATLVFSLFGVGAAKAATFGLLVRFKSTLLHLPAIPEALKVPHAMNGKIES